MGTSNRFKIRRMKHSYTLLTALILFPACSNNTDPSVPVIENVFTLRVFMTNLPNQQTADTNTTEAKDYAVFSNYSPHEFIIHTVGVPSQLGSEQYINADGDLEVEGIILPFASQKPTSLYSSTTTHPNQPFEYPIISTVWYETAYLGNENISIDSEVFLTEKVRLVIRSESRIEYTNTVTSEGYDSLILNFSPKLAYIIQEATHHFLNRSVSNEYIMNRKVISYQLAK
jgi:hypothetical protein